MSQNLFDFGMIGLGVMGRNLLLNMADHGFSVIGFDKDETKNSALESSATPGTTVKGVSELAQMIQLLQRPRKVMMLVPAGQPVDDVIASLLPLLEKGDVIIDGGNSHYTDTLRRVKYLREKDIHFMGIGVSGGEKGARTGPSIMPGGDKEAYAHVQPMLEAIAAKVNGEPCVAYLGKEGAGHYVKMVHNGIEYAIMQLISESYAILKKAGLSNQQLHEVFKSWNEGDLQSFLVEITADIFLQKDDKTDAHLVDVISDKAGSKGTGKWTSQDSMELPVAVPVIDTAVAMRTLSGYKDERVVAAELYGASNAISEETQVLIQQVHDALYFATVLAYAQGLAMLFQASKDLQMEIPLTDVVSVWRGGCIIRSSLLSVFTNAYKQTPELSNILLNQEVAALVKSVEGNTRSLIAFAAQSGIPAAALMSSLAYFDAYKTAYMPTNLIQAQRDYFGAHTYQRTDIPGTFHTEWGQQ
ncbi:6-phosphogluconate dehydrogenase [Dyadobacter sp. BE34]|uniref:6-phosphogluconate dehydrogenase, decarboxylating n=1 Tax=Dyadobacter fermentans TaxID=94254 RepID=A0ABU1QTW2_9BACT|nr:MULTISPECIES: NADP-dependent phosphogluconate dehydrogenase [Dyadobacter]MDR6804185.1 6-phosphogluconate dehydrogenase [Dyadobacter fermentans]MDR7041925.1 6-phosphogluconate dehydrogenase [Dyadobacter sp. BE242]MDR7196328.1 6-phosphogluconate dehydrogenase [Dyadobacter sp. BE34]MDR7213127.1 6-phosphogluconate dehydrogenase [Dyadobacter sp. BE31]MDR7261734.1 6-phosphogluconate dehydrogenase [Dyadobacter sp. BE32]